MPIKPYLYVLATLLLGQPYLVWSADVTDIGTVSHYQSQQRYAFGAKLLELALTKTGLKFEIKAIDENAVNEGRGELMVIRGQLDVQWHSTTAKREASMIPIKIPVYRGMLGLRLLLAKNSRAAELSNIQTLAQLQKYTGGHGTHWGDLPVYATNNLPVRTHVDYELLFKWLIDERFDYFHRGMNEIWPEQKRYSEELSVVDNVMLFYPHPVYFFVTHHRPDLAKKLELGLQKAIDDGSYKALFFEEHQSILNQSNLSKRRLIKLSNPVAPDLDPEVTQWWLPANK